MPPAPQPSCPVGRAVTVAIVLLLVATAAGCGSRRPALARVGGTVTLDGEPLAEGTLTFEAPGLRSATARIVAGRIVDATTYRRGDGVPVGTHAIAVFAREAPPPGAPSDPGTTHFAADAMVGRSLVPRRYNDPATSGLSATIATGTNSLTLALTRQPPRHE